MSKFTFDELTKTLTDGNDLKTIRDRLLFHYFNPNGAVADKRAADVEIDRAVADGICMSGAILAYGGLATYHEDKLSKLIVMIKPRGWNVDYHIKGVRETAAKARRHIAEKTAEREAK